MSGKLSSQGTKLYIQSTDLPAGDAITGATQASPTVLTFAALPAGAAAGKVVVVQGSGWKSIEGKPFAITEIDATAHTITLGDSDTSNEANAIDAAAKAALVTFEEICMATLTFTSPAGAVIDVTTLCDTARETVSGLPGIATWQATGFWDASDAAQKLLRDLYRTQENVAIQVVFRDGSGLVFEGGVNQFDIRAGIDQAVAITVGGNVSGQINYMEPNPAMAFSALAEAA